MVNPPSTNATGIQRKGLFVVFREEVSLIKLKGGRVAPYMIGDGMRRRRRMTPQRSATRLVRMRQSVIDAEADGISMCDPEDRVFPFDDAIRHTRGSKIRPVGALESARTDAMMRRIGLRDGPEQPETSRPRTPGRRSIPTTSRFQNIPDAVAMGTANRCGDRARRRTPDWVSATAWLSGKRIVR